MVTKEQKAAIVAEFGKDANDTGTPAFRSLFSPLASVSSPSTASSTPTTSTAAVVC